MPGLRWRRLVVVQECYCCAVEAGVAAELGFDQSGDRDGVLGEGLFHGGVEWVPEDVAGESYAEVRFPEAARPITPSQRPPARPARRRSAHYRLSVSEMSRVA
jgi:hypothetical protein